MIHHKIVLEGGYMSKKDEEVFDSDDLNSILNEIEKKRHQRSKNSLIFTAILAVCLILFGFLLKSSVTKSFSQKALQSALKSVTTQMTPLLHNYATKLAEGLPEVYWQAAVSEFKKREPGLRKSVLDESHKMGDDIKKHLTAVITQKILEDPEIKSKLAPSLDTKNVELVSQIIQEESKKFADRMSMKILDLYQEDIDKMIAATEDFPRDSRSSGDEAVAVKMLLHYLLNLADEELMNQPPYVNLERGGADHV